MRTRRGSQGRQSTPRAPATRRSSVLQKPERADWPEGAFALFPIADVERYRAVREGFTTALVQDPRVRNLLDRWTARLNGSGRRPPEPENLRARQTWRRAVSRAAMARANEACDLLRNELRLPWPMVILLLGSISGEWKAAAAKAGALPDDRGVLELGYLPIDSLAPPIGLHSEPQSGESIGGARRRISLAYQEAERQLQEAERQLQAKRRGAGRRRPKKVGDHLQRSGRWFYEARVRKPARTIAELGRELHAARPHGQRPHGQNDEFLSACGCRRDVRKAIHQAEALLNLNAELLLNPDRLYELLHQAEAMAEGWIIGGQEHGGRVQRLGPSPDRGA